MDPSSAGEETEVSMNMEKLPASGYYVEPDNCSNGGSDVSLDAGSAEARGKAESIGRKSGGYRRSPGFGRSVGSKQKGGRKTVSRSEEPAPEPQGGPLERTKRLIMAALRVWELKRGIRKGGSES